MDNYDGKTNTHPLDYGTDPGNLEVRKLIAGWNDRNFGLTSPSDPDCLNLTSGASVGLTNILQQFTSPQNDLTRRAFFVSPTYFLINSIFIDGGFGGKLSAVVEEEDGQIDIPKFEKQIQYYESIEPKPKDTITEEDIKAIFDPSRPVKKIFRYVLYVVPTFSNPKGGSLNMKTRLALIELARKYHILIVCDDVYDLLDYREGSNLQHYKRLVYLDRETLPEGEVYGNVISNATFSKLVGPGLRAGYQESATPKLAFLLSQGGASRSGGSPSQLNTIIIGDIIRTGEIDTIISALVKEYSARAKVLKQSIRKYLPKGTKFSAFEGGYFGWVVLPDLYDLKKISNECLKRGVVLATGDNFEVTGDRKGWGSHGVRLSLSFLSPGEIEEGIKIWGDVCKDSTL
ncbi:DEKNAAC101294 [Brettanomyces naardenensis]|uniref:DEKNAAC101294 n=1 Tax=Brettanomyces naardenensis TaxID=13370 RepID=A0A448YI12_BRENA|nr:DEKNAAC101294 [Brettanomyces naardenensis]